ncbi:MAG: hypothetical protein ACYDAQ_03880 [Mycobacteriales bacterium]
MGDYPVRLGMALVTLVEPHRGREVDYNRWYERDHFYAGCLIGASCFAGARFVATRELKALRYPRDSPVVADPATGSYLGVYWVVAGEEDSWNAWAVEQVNRLHREGRMFTERDHIHTLLYDFDYAVSRDADGVPAELALDHRFAGLVMVVGQAGEGGRSALDPWLREALLPDLLRGSAAALALSFTPRPLLAHAPGDVPRVADVAGRFLHLYFLDGPPQSSWSATFAGLGRRLAEDGRGAVLFASGFLPTIPGTDTYTDQLW